MPNSLLCGGAHSGAMITRIVKISTRCNNIDSQLTEKAGKTAVKLALAEVTAIRRVTEVVRVSEFFRPDDPVANPNFPGKGLGFLKLALGKTLGDSRYGDHLVCQGDLRGHGYDCAINTARERHCHPSITAQRL